MACNSHEELVMAAVMMVVFVVSAQKRVVTMKMHRITMRFIIK